MCYIVPHFTVKVVAATITPFSEVLNKGFFSEDRQETFTFPIPDRFSLIYHIISSESFYYNNIEKKSGK